MPRLEESKHGWILCCDMYKRINYSDEEQQTQAVKVSSRRGYIN
jgi:hypothetical protein